MIKTEGRMARASNWRWLSGVRRAVARSSCASTAKLDAIKSNAAVFNSPVINNAAAAAAARSCYSEEQEDQDVDDGVVPVYREEEAAALLNSREDLAAIAIQAFFRGHLARRAFRALKSLVRVQALVRGACVRRQTRLAIHCMQALVRLQVRVRARRHLIDSTPPN